MAESPVAPLRRGQLPAGGPDHAANPVHDHLGDAVSPPDDEGRRTVVDQDHPDLAAIIRVDRARRVDQRHAVFQGQPAPGPDLGLVPFGKGHRDARRDQLPFPGEDRRLLCNRREQIHPRRLLRHVGGQRQIFRSRKSSDAYPDLFYHNTVRLRMVKTPSPLRTPDRAPRPSGPRAETSGRPGSGSPPVRPHRSAR